MDYVRIHEIPQERIDRMGPPYSRIIKHVVAPWIQGSENIWLGVAIVDPGNTSNPHSHADQEEVFFVISGRGGIMVDGETVSVEPGTCVFVPKGKVHQLINTGGQETLKVVAVTSPPFVPERFREDHLIGKS